jgi:NADH-quinone oxidoreductase subunit L
MPDLTHLFTSLPTWQWQLLLAVPLIPLVGYVIQIFWGKHLPRQGDWLLTGGMGVVMIITVYMFFVAKGHAGGHGEHAFFAESIRDGFSWDWLYQARDKPAGFSLPTGLMYDGLGAAMLAVVGIVSFFVHLFSVGYMKGDRRFYIFFANISLFTFAMLALVLSDNLLFLFIFWELMGLMSYLLIGHFAQDPTSHRIKQAAAACKKAFLTTRVGDTCLLFGMAMFYVLLPEHYNTMLEHGEMKELIAQGLISGEQISGTFRFTDLWHNASMLVQANGGEYPLWMTVAGLFIFGGTVGKSAQFPLHIWLPDAMEGPTPVSAMIHAATRVAAGVFLLGRTFPLMSPEVLAVIAAVGAITALFAATIGCTVFDIKGVLAYSTISQLGFMVAAIGCGALGLVAGLFHMVTHAFFKACLFLSAGSVIHGCHHEQDMRKMGGLRKKMPITFVCMLVCTLAISGMPLFSGFHSKDRIIAAAFGGASLGLNGGNFAATVFLPIAACLTTFYMFRLIFMTFFGEPRDHHVDEHAHESPKTMTISLAALATFGLFGGYVWFLHPTDLLGSHGTWFTEMVDWRTMYPGVDLTTTNLAGMVAGLPHRHGTAAADLEHFYHGFNPHWTAMIASVSVLVVGIFLAVQMYLRRKWSPEKVTSSLGEAYTWVSNKYYVDEAVNASVIKGTTKAAQIQTWIDENIVDGLVLTVGRIGKGLGFFCAWIDKHIVDGTVNLVGNTTQALGSVVRLFQTGRIQQYVSFAVAGGIVVAAFHLLT